MRVAIDEDRCCGYAVCVSRADKVFDIGPDNIAVVLVTEPTGELAKQARVAAGCCPTEAIVIED